MNEAYQHISGEDFMNSLPVEVPSDGRPTWRSEWACGNQACAVREVAVQVVPGGRLPALVCPACGRLLRFVCYLQTFLVPHS